ncbi:MAG: Zn-ribbon domain-containing OB-fold protein [Lautropia sp.]
MSIYTGSRRLTWKPVSGLGHVYAFTTLRAKGLGADGRLPYRLALVELAEGVRILANLRGPENADWRIGDAVLLAWEQLAEGRQYPIFVRHETHADSATARARIDA